MPRERLRILTWQVHGNYLWYLSQLPHEWWLVTRPGIDGQRWAPGYAGRSASFPWGANVREIAHERVGEIDVDVVLYQSRAHWEQDRHQLLSAAQRERPCVYLEHDPPQQHPTNTRHWAADEAGLLVHVTPFNALMWDSGAARTRVIEHAALVPQQARYRGEIERGLVVVNHLAKRGRRLGADVYLGLREQVPLDLVGMDAQAAPGGIGEIPNAELPHFMSRYRFFFNPIRWTSLGLATIEAMSIGMPIIALATTELPSVIRNGENGWCATDPKALVEPMRALLRDPALARQWGENARRTAQQRFGFGRFMDEWNQALHQVLE
jgi:glycosyltransferase involved in cell wall biosynthesis